MQQGEYAEQGLVRVDVVAGDPAAGEFALLVEGVGEAAEAVRLLHQQGAGRVDQDDVLGASKAEEPPGFVSESGQRLSTVSGSTQRSSTLGPERSATVCIRFCSGVSGR